MINRPPVRKAVIPCAGYGTRFLPATKANPKEMMPIVDKPVIQYIIEEAVASGIEEIVLITGSNKRAIEDHFDYNFELEEMLKRAGKLDQYRQIREISDMAKFIYVRQKEQLGNGHAVLQAKEVIGDEPFVVIWGDELFDANPPRIKQMIDTYQQHGGAVIASYTTDDPEAPYRYGIVRGRRLDAHVTELDEILEKPGDGVAGPWQVAVGGYVFPPSIFKHLETVQPGKGGEIWLVDAISQLAREEPIYAYEIENGRYYDCGNKLEYLKVNIDFALKRSDIGRELRQYLEVVMKGHDVK